MLKAKNGQDVKVHYRGTLEDGTEFDNSHNRGQTLDFKIGSNTLLPSFESAVVGMAVGQKKTFKIEEAYGKLVPEAVVPVSKSLFPDNFVFNIGEQVLGQTETGQPIPAIIKSVSDDTVMLDHNHPLAGKDLTFEVELVEID